MLFFVAQSDPALSAAGAFLAGAWGWGFLVALLMIVLGIFVGGAIAGNIRNGAKAEGGLDKQPQNCDDAKTAQKALLEAKEKAGKIVEELQSAKTSAIITASISGGIAVAAAIAAIAIGWFPPVSITLAAVAATALATMTAALVVLAEVNKLLAEFERYQKHLDDLLSLVAQSIQTLCP